MGEAGPGLAGVLALLMVAAPLAGCIGSAPGSVTDDEPTAATGEAGFSDTAVYPGNYSDDGNWSKVLEDGPYDILKPEVTNLESDLDGAQIQVGVVKPDVPNGTDVPVIVYASPYIFTGMDNLEDQFMWEPLVPNFVPHGYAVAFVPVRGTANAGGCMDLMGPKERHDLDQAITWLGEQDWSNGNVSMIGVSYDGSTPWEVAAQGNPHLKTIVPISGVNDIYHLMYRNGTDEGRGPVILNALYYTFGFAFYNPLMGGRSAQHTLRGAVCPESWHGLAASTYSPATGERDPTGWWAARNSRPGVEANYNGSILMVQGLTDWNVDPGHQFPWIWKLDNEHGLTVKYMLGQWDHAAPDYAGEDSHPRWDWAEKLLHWFDYWLKGDRSVDLGPKVEVQASNGQWRHAQAWPPEDATKRTYHLTPSMELSRNASSETGQATVAASDKGWFEGAPGGPHCPKCPAFTTKPAEHDWHFAGIPKVHVTVTPTTPSGHVSAWLYLVTDDEKRRVGWGQIDLRFADGDESAEPVVPGQPMKLKMVLEPLDVHVPKGAKLRLELHQGSYGDHAPSAGGPVQLQLGDEQSTFTVKAFTRADDSPRLFTPPGTGPGTR